MADVSEGEGNANLLSLLKKLHLGHLENFQREKVTVDQVCKLSDKQMEWWDGPTERISSFVDHIRQPIAKTQSYLKDTTDFIEFIEKTKVPENTIFVSMNVTSLHINIAQEEGINTVCKAYEAFYQKNAPKPTHSLTEMLKLILHSQKIRTRDHAPVII